MVYINYCDHYSQSHSFYSLTEYVELSELAPDIDYYQISVC